MITDRKANVLIVDDEPSIRDLLGEALSGTGYEVAMACDGDEAVALLKKKNFDVVLTDLRMPRVGGLEVVKAARNGSSNTEVIVMTGFGTVEERERAFRLGAHDFLSKSSQFGEIEPKIKQILLRDIREHTSNARLQTDFSRPIVGSSEPTLEVLRMIRKIGPTKSSVLLTGPTGTGKELVARALHEASPLRERPFIALNCAALAPGVLESELFGHEKGAFSGAVSRRIGRFEQANGGTLFLDEVGEIDSSVQIKLLRALQEGEFERVGGMETKKVNVRIIAATNRDLRKAIEEGTFREDFYYRLNVFSIHLEPLRNRRSDIPALVDLFLARIGPQLNKDLKQVEDEVLEIFMQYTWPGNVRELENVLERAAVLAESDVITRRDLPPDMLQNLPGVYSPAYRELAVPEGASLHRRTDELEKGLIRESLERFHWNKTKTATYLGIKRTTLQYKIRKYDLD